MLEESEAVNNLSRHDAVWSRGSDEDPLTLVSRLDGTKTAEATKEWERRHHQRRRWDDTIRTQIRRYESRFHDEARRDRIMLVRAGETPSQWIDRLRATDDFADLELSLDAVQDAYDRYSLLAINERPAASLVSEYVLWLLFAHDRRVRDTVAYQRYLTGMPAGIRLRSVTSP